MNETEKTTPRKSFVILAIVAISLACLFFFVFGIPIDTRVRVYVEISRDKIDDVWITKEQVPLIVRLFPPPWFSDGRRGAYTLCIIISTGKGVHNYVSLTTPTGIYFEETEISKRYWITVDLWRNGTKVDQFSFNYESPWSENPK